jgi:hypothetical protein
MPPTFLLLLRVFVATENCPPSRCLVTIRWDTLQKHRLIRGMNEVAVEMGSGAMIYIPSFIKIGSVIQKLMGAGDSRTHRQHGDRLSLL